MEPNILKRIFFDENNHWDKFAKKHHKNLRPNVVKEVEKLWQLKERIQIIRL
jgi:hypothetical protein